MHDLETIYQKPRNVLTQLLRNKGNKRCYPPHPPFFLLLPPNIFLFGIGLRIPFFWNMFSNEIKPEDTIV